MEYRKLNYIKNGVNRCRAIDRAASREQFPMYAPVLFSPSASISFAAYYSPDYHNAVIMNCASIIKSIRKFPGVHAMCSRAWPIFRKLSSLANGSRS